MPSPYCYCSTIVYAYMIQSLQNCNTFGNRSTLLLSNTISNRYMPHASFSVLCSFAHTQLFTSNFDSFFCDYSYFIKALFGYLELKSILTIISQYGCMRNIFVYYSWPYKGDTYIYMLHFCCIGAR